MTEKQGMMLDGDASIVFTLYQLQKELSDKGHTFSYDELKDAIRVLNRTDYYSQRRRREYGSSFFTD